MATIESKNLKFLLYKILKTFKYAKMSNTIKRKKKERP